MSEISIYIDNLFSSFESHLKENKRVLFSGRYGIGKTYFLKQFFNNKSKYNAFHIFPINYQVSPNEDIFELIKIDILNHILDKGWPLMEVEKISRTLALQAYIYNNSPNILQSILKIFTFGKSKSITEGGVELENVWTNFNKYYKDLNKNPSISEIEHFISHIGSQKGSIYEFDSISRLIYDLLENNKGTDEDIKENVLIIDDIDRIDPDHIFRILNVFSAHFDSTDEDENKFGFDRIIFVCDIQNISNVFTSKYGENADFNGYINKFFSSCVYIFNNQEETKKTVRNFISYELGGIDTHKILYRSIKYEINLFLEYFIDSGVINVRHLKNLEKFNFTNYTYNRDITSNILYIHLIKLFLHIFNNDKQKLIQAFSISSNYYKNIQDKDNHLLSDLIIILHYHYYIQLNDHHHDSTVSFSYYSQELNTTINFRYNTDYTHAIINSIKPNTVNNLSIESNTIKNLSIYDILKLFIVAIDVADKNSLLYI